MQNFFELEAIFETLSFEYPDKPSVVYLNDCYHLKSGETMNEKEFLAWAKNEFKNGRSFYVASRPTRAAPDAAKRCCKVPLLSDDCTWPSCNLYKNAAPVS